MGLGGSSHQQSALPARLGEHPVGTLHVPISTSESARAERLRDMMRSLQSEAVFIAGQRRLNQVSGVGSGGDVGRDARDANFKVLSDAIGVELSAQGYSLHVRTVSTVWRTFACPCRRVVIAPGVLQNLVTQVAAHISVGPGLHVAAHCGLPPALWQPVYVVCIGAGQARVLTLAFIGEPVMGDRPEYKRTPFVLQLLTDNLLTNVGRRAANVVHYEGQHVSEGARTTLEHFVSREEVLFEALEKGDWSHMLPTLGITLSSFLSFRGSESPSRC